MGNKFCKVNNNFVVSADKSFANCITDSEYEAMKKGHGAVSPPGEPQPGRCMYHDIDALRKSGVSELPQTKQSPVYASNLKDSGMKCVKTRRSDGPDEVTATGPIPSNMFEMKPKASASQQDIDAFESNYGLLIMNVVGEPNNKNMNDIIDKMFDTSVMNTNASTPSSTTSTPQVPSQPLPQAPQATSQSTPQASPSTVNVPPPKTEQSPTLQASTTSSLLLQWTLTISLYVLVFLVVVIFVAMLISFFIESPYSQYGGKVVKKLLKKVK
jgi:hypothetical protein